MYLQSQVLNVLHVYLISVRSRRQTGAEVTVGHGSQVTGQYVVSWTLDRDVKTLGPGETV